ncbi:hypothetical protein HFV02_14285 [Acidithiobacillus caldus]|uniref:hypothetical protein n=1 Tax=Acidithiobacillus caldus TaxID=33059 RepID=UPI001C065D58|nr:hypothetical protein [Acidithiobacillus caldus]MBU2803395.1 hypothetical protein [Acidithiobacillus caldus]
MRISHEQIPQIRPTAAEDARGGKVDVLLLAPNLRHLPIHDIALGEGSTVVKIPAAMRRPTPA